MIDKIKNPKNVAIVTLITCLISKAATSIFLTTDANSRSSGTSITLTL